MSRKGEVEWEGRGRWEGMGRWDVEEGVVGGGMRRGRGNEKGEWEGGRGNGEKGQVAPSSQIPPMAYQMTQLT